MRRVVLDAVQTVGVFLAAAGAALQFGAGPALMVGGSLLIVIPFIEAHLLRRG